VKVLSPNEKQQRQAPGPYHVFYASCKHKHHLQMILTTTTGLPKCVSPDQQKNGPSQLLAPNTVLASLHYRTALILCPALWVIYFIILSVSQTTKHLIITVCGYKLERISN